MSMNRHFFLRQGLFVIMMACLSCRSSGGGSKKDPEEINQAGQPQRDAPSGDEGEPGIPSASAPELSPRDFPSEKMFWSGMRNDCGGTGRILYMDLNQLGVTGGLQYPYAAMVIDLNRLSVTNGTSGVLGTVVNSEVCRMMSAYFNGLNDTWEGRDYLDVFQKGDRVAFEPEIEVDYRSAITLDSMASFNSELASPRSFPVLNPETSINISTNFGSKGVILIKDVPMKLDCVKQLSYQLYTYQSTYPTSETGQKYCRKIPQNADGLNAECLGVDHSICKQPRDARGVCPIENEPPALDACSYVIEALPVIDYSGANIATVKVGGYLFKKPKDSSNRRGYRMTVNRVEILASTP